MNFRNRVLAFGLVAVICAIAVWLVMAFTGVLDSGKFEIVQSETISPNHIAMLAVRSDNSALTGATYFVVIDNHLYSAKELKETFYSSRPVFVAGRDGLHIHASSSNVLVIECKGCGITKDLFEKQRFEDDGITIRYVGFP
jgi:ABC-type branched-subunit amino acid transport system permease subunit